MTDQTPQPSPAGDRIELLLATWNSAEYLEPLIASLQAQTVQDFHLVISDDCSTDDTVAMLKRHLHSFRNPVELRLRDTPSGSAAANFKSLMQQSRGDFVFLCDGDDIWHPRKLEVFLAAARRHEARLGRDVPLFLFSDADVIDGAGKVTHESYWAFKNTDGMQCRELPRLLLYGPALGCASMMNAALVRRASDVPLGRIAGHDWWIALVAASLGVVDAVPDQTVSYRIHGKNNSHPREVSLRAFSRMSAPVHEVRRRLAVRMRQAEPLLEQFSADLTPERKRVIERFIAIRDRSFLRRRIDLVRYGYRYPDTLRNAAVLLFC